MICTYIYRYIYIYKVASKNGFLICNACSHSHSPTLHLSQRYSLFVFPFLFTLPFSFFFLYQTRTRRRKVFAFSLSFFFLFQKALSKVLCVDSLRYLQRASSATAPPTCCAIAMRDHARGSGGFGCVVPEDRHDHLGIIGQPTAFRPRDNRGSACAWHSSLHELISISYAFVRVLLTVLFGANRIRYRRGTLSPLTPRS